MADSRELPRVDAATALPISLRALARLLVVVACISAFACARNQETFPQRVVGTVAVIGATSGEASVKLLSWSESGCAGAGTEVKTDGQGGFVLDRTLLDKDPGQHDLLCIAVAGGWEPVWEHHYVGAPLRLDIICAGTVGSWKCEVFGDGISYAQP